MPNEPVCMHQLLLPPPHVRLDACCSRMCVRRDMENMQNMYVRDSDECEHRQRYRAIITIIIMMEKNEILHNSICVGCGHEVCRVRFALVKRRCAMCVCEFTSLFCKNNKMCEQQQKNERKEKPVSLSCMRGTSADQVGCALCMCHGIIATQKISHWLN